MDNLFTKFFLGLRGALLGIFFIDPPIPMPVTRGFFEQLFFYQKTVLVRIFQHATHVRDLVLVLVQFRHFQNAVAEILIATIFRKSIFCG